jgi:hypothetical protein
MPNDQNFGGSFNAHKHWKKLREKHKKTDLYKARTGLRQYTPEVYEPNKQTIEGSERLIPKDLYDLNYDLAFGNITEEEYKQRKAKLDLGQ